MFTPVSHFPCLEIPSHGIILRECASTDATDWLSIVNDPVTQPFLPSTYHTNRVAQAKDTCEYLRQFFYNRSGIFWAISLETGQMIGCCGFENINADDRRAEIAFELLSSYHGKGIMSAAIKAVVTYGLGTMGLNRIDAITMIDNTPAIRTLKRAHFSLEGTLSEYRKFHGEFIDVCIFGLTAKQWLSCL